MSRKKWVLILNKNLSPMSHHTQLVNLSVQAKHWPMCKMSINTEVFASGNNFNGKTPQLTYPLFSQM